ncbi:uncharacterized protein B0T23DRAFT_435871 [Neurospora hispaniola]|uniref:Uncharacterized protein n=1 Tax=Neurospora hispaniola TaxID=588809 RepID=A0AAJ0MW43_9PEZI|nr:hypothetical protein B0T23DRAFT_435871 [Neurospora hispaniola]
MFGLVLDCHVEAEAGAIHDSESIESSNSGHLEGIGEIEYRTGEVEEDVVFVNVSRNMNVSAGAVVAGLSIAYRYQRQSNAACLAARQPAVWPHYGLPVALSSRQFWNSKFPIDDACDLCKKQQQQQNTNAYTSVNITFNDPSDGPAGIANSSNRHQPWNLLYRENVSVTSLFSCSCHRPLQGGDCSGQVSQIARCGVFEHPTSPPQHEPSPPFWQAHYTLFTCPAIAGRTRGTNG